MTTTDPLVKAVRQLSHRFLIAVVLVAVALGAIAVDSRHGQCETQNDVRTATIELVRQLETGDGADADEPHQFTVPEGADVALAAFIVEQVNPFLGGLSESSTETPATDLAKKVLAPLDCGLWG